MEANKVTTLLVFSFLATCVILPCEASACSSDKDCLHFEYCCKGNCTWTRLRCEHICQSDHECRSESRCLLGICVNCSTDFSCTKKNCLNDSHCPRGHSCEKKFCVVKKQSNLMAEMAPFLIFITALAVSLLIVCYNDYFIERLGQQGWRERLERMSCNCSLILWFWMWRFRRSQQQSNESSSCPGVEVQFDYRSSSYPSNSLNEKPTRQRAPWPSRSLLFFWRRNCEDTVGESSTLEGNNDGELTTNAESSNTVILLNRFMNTNQPVMSSSNHQSSSLREQREQNIQRSGKGQNSSETALNCSCSVVESTRFETQTRITQSSDQESNNHVSTCSREVTTV